jgi:class 3 adenylate cyclase
MSTSLEEQINQLQKIIAEMESQRAVLGDETVTASLLPLQEKLAALEAEVERPKPELPTRQRKLVTLLFTDVVGSTKMTQHLDPEDTLEIMDAALRRLAEPIKAHGGHVTRFQGDALRQSSVIRSPGRMTQNKPSGPGWISWTFPRI